MIFLLSKKLKNYNIRYIVKPPLIGWAQVNYPYGASIQDSKWKSLVMTFITLEIIQIY